MATRVNKKFVIILTSSLVVVFLLLAGLGYYAMLTRNDKNIARGDAAFAEGNFYDAKLYYGRAVNREDTNIEWLELYIAALSKSAPESSVEYDKFYSDLQMAQQRLAGLKETDIDFQIEYVAARNEAIRRTATRVASFTRIVDLTEDAVKFIRPDEPKLAKIFRYRGLALVDRMSLDVIDLDLRLQAEKDLKTAIEFDPDDEEAQIGLARWEFAEMERFRRDRNLDRVTTKYEQGMKLLDEFLAEHPNHPEATLLRANRQYFEQNRRAVSPAEQSRLRAMSIPLVQEVLDVFTNADPAELKYTPVQSLAGLCGVVRDIDKAPLLELVSTMIEHSPADMRLIMLEGRLQMQMGDFEDSIETYQKVVDAEKPTVSLEGRLLPIYKMQALANQIDVSLGMYSVTDNKQEQEAALAQAIAYRDALEKLVGVTAVDELNLRNAKIAVVMKDYDVAVTNLSQIIKSGVGDPVQNHRLLAHALREQGNLGEARSVMIDLLELNPNDPQLLIEIAEYDINLSDFTSARDRLALALEGNPENELIQQRLREVETALDPESENADPIVSTVLLSRKFRDDTNFAEAERIVRERLDEYPNEYRLVRELAEVLVRQEKRAEALEVIDEALAASPNNERLSKIRLVIAEQDPVVLGIQLIELSDATDVDKLVDKFQVYIRHGKSDEADAALDEARRMGPTNPRVIELDFLLALHNNDKAEARQIIERATNANADQLGGVLYNARYNMRFSNTGDESISVNKAISILSQAAENSPRNPAIWLLLGEAMAQAGRVEDAVEQFAKAYEGRPNDAKIIKAYALALERVNRESEALELITPAAGIVRQTMSDPEIVELWLRLAETHGDRKEVLRIRRDLFRAEPGVFNYRNALNHFRLLIEEEEGDQAASVIAKLLEIEAFDALVFTILQVELTEARDGIDAALDLYKQYFLSLDDSTTQRDRLLAHLNYGNFLIQNDRLEEGAEVYEAGKPYQTELLEIERQLGDLYFRLGNHQQDLAFDAQNRRQEAASSAYQQKSEEYMNLAADHYRSILAIATDANPSIAKVRKRYTETLLKLGKVEDAKASLAMVPEGRADLETIILRASIAMAEGNQRDARDYYDTAVELFPSQTLPYVQRALFNAGDVSLRADAIDDLRKAVSLRPDLIQAWNELYRLNKLSGNMDTAFAELRRAISANPKVDSLQITLISEQFAAGRREDGIITAIEAIRSRPNDKQWLFAVANILASSERYREASELYTRLINLTKEGEEPDVRYAAGLLDSTLLREDIAIPDSRIFDILRNFRGVMDETNVYHVMLEARALSKVKETDAAFEKLKQALAITENSGILGVRWFGQLQLLSDDRDRSYAFLKQVDERGNLNPFLVVQLQNYLRNEGSAVDPLLAKINQVLAGNPDTITRLDALKNKSRFLYTLDRFEESAQAIEAALEITPNDVELNNNLAYIYVEHLGKFEEAIHYAEIARARDEFSSNTLDTLGWAYYHAGRLDEARDLLREAIDKAKSDTERIPARIHLGFVELKSGNIRAARQAYDRALQKAESSREMAQQYRDKLELLREALEAAP